MTDTIDAPVNEIIVDNTAPPISREAEAKATFNRFKQEAEGTPELVVEKTKAEVAPEKPKADDSEFPEEMITGRKKTEPEEDLIKSRPKGQITHDHFDRLQKQADARIRAIETERDEWKGKVDKATVPENLTKELETLRKEREDLNAHLERVAVERSPKFQKEFVARETSLRTAFEKSAADAGVDPVIAKEIYSASGKRLFEMMGSLSIDDPAKAYLSSLLARRDEIGMEKESFLSQSREQLGKWEQEQQELTKKEQAHRAQQEQEVFDRVGKKAMEIYEPFQEVEGNEKWNSNAKALKAEADRFFRGETTLEEVAMIAHAGVAAKQIHKINEVLRTRLSEALTKLEQYKTAAPHTNGVGKNGNGDHTKGMTAEERARDTFNRAIGGTL